MQVVNTAKALQKAVDHSGTVGLVPTMGALHEGHLSLIRRARIECSVVVVSIYVNPTQFGPAEDFTNYPRDLDSDLVQCKAVGVDVIFTPTDEKMYPAGARSTITPPAVTAPLEGRCRPGHFAGVCTVVHRLFELARPDRAYFGQKDAQQAAVVKAMVTEHKMPVEIVICPTVREPDGLALSSRNAYLSTAERKNVLCLYRALQTGKNLIDDGERARSVVEDAMRREIESVAGAKIDYTALVDPQTFQPRDPAAPPLLLAVAACIGKTRLIDNWLIEK